MRFSTAAAAVASALVLACSAAHTSGQYNLYEKRDSEPHAWQKRHRAVADQILPIRIALKQRNLENAEAYIYDVANPSSPNFGHNWVQFDGTVQEAEQLFATEYWHYEHAASGGLRLACDHYSLPAHVQEHVDFAMPTLQLDGLRPVANFDRSLMTSMGGGVRIGSFSCGELITVDCLRKLYKFPAGSSSAADNQMGVGEWADYLYEDDLPDYFRNFSSPEIPADTRPEFIAIDGGLRANLTTVSLGSGVESALDVQTAYSIIYPQKLRLYQVGDGVNIDSTGTFNIFLDALDESYCTYQGGDQPYLDPAYPDPNDNQSGYQGPLQCGGAPKSNVISVSYGQTEGALPEFYQVRQCNEWMKLGLQGVSVLFASGDSGVANRYNSGYSDSCLNADLPYVDNNGTRFSPSFPDNCPYITSVGGTELIGNTTDSGERAGFLGKYAPAYGPNVYNDSGNARGFLDVAAIGLNVAIVFDGNTYGVGGTSASAPIFAGIVTLLNEARIEAGKGPIGFLNPTLYSNPDAFNDITIGNNPGCGTAGFNATPGWDPVTGLGTPNFQKLRDIFLALP
ncbi:Pro-kumamolisin [Diaporthe helianthi]|uniref:Pro-kumamolisin n=1 Tax=Diaporthe helianthi TaxID=158607 RepID=A0A2P5HHW1_DIAHE|nr:Pro-kumamolisin [Diaporthe helianthi]